ncbi:hypothetical protein GCM10007981_04480 [Thermocladium modestius]|uniref:Uncharacterized protein n=1 Tax=Thermocladium modestius TaxID=62609 RepID=A0A830GUC5_9CREN|nr:hypothetical protein [Thermocladium modestius]GGP19708.1 hypothetical protein GCM10007981_04480 [Thermocladium modestius]
MGEAEKVTLPAAFVLGLMIGRRVKARVEYVEPKITFIPRPQGGQAQSIGFREFTNKLRDELAKMGIPPQAASSIAGELASSQEVKAFIALMGEREDIIQILSSAPKSLENGQISSMTYQEITRRYMNRLIEVEKELSDVQSKLDEAISGIINRAEALIRQGFSSPQ